MPGGTPHNGLLGEAPSKRGTFCRPQEYCRVGISLVDVYKRVGKSVFPSVKHLKGLIEEFMTVNKSRKVPGSVTYSYF